MSDSNEHVSDEDLYAKADDTKVVTKRVSNVVKSINENALQLQVLETEQIEGN